jgi:hypothetical protein
LVTPILGGAGEVVVHNEIDHGLKDASRRRSARLHPKLQRVRIDVQLGAQLLHVAGDFDGAHEKLRLELAHDRLPASVVPLSEIGLVRYLIPKDRYAHVAVLRCEGPIRDHVEGIEKRLQWRGLATGEPPLNGVRGDLEISGEPPRAAQSIGRFSQRRGVPAALIHAATQSR